MWRGAVVDLSEAKAGDKVKFRCGGEAVITEKSCGSVTVQIAFRHYNEPLLFYRAGQLSHSGHIGGLLDIIAIEPKPFDWADVRPGMAFRYDRTDQKDCQAFFVLNGKMGPLFSIDMAHPQYLLDVFALRRDPEFDIEVPHA
jgi:hypothetical protein